MQVIKRNGTTQEFNRSKIFNAVYKCCSNSELPEEEASTIAELVTSAVVDNYSGTSVIPVEDIQDDIESILMSIGKFKQAKQYILYREERAKLRANRANADNNAIAEYIHFAKYARYLPDKLRRETYSETVNRVKQMHLEKYPYLQEHIEWAFDFVFQKKVLPSMRSLQFGGPAIKEDNARMFNCSFSYFDRPQFLQEAIYLLLCGVGVGYSVQNQHVNKLPSLKVVNMESPVEHFHIEDSKIGWADAVGKLLDSYINGYFVEFDYSSIRKRGTPLVTSGGRAPGHVGLRNAIERMRRDILTPAMGRQLKPIECHRLVCTAADAILSGGVRRSSCIALFSPDDLEMLYCKTGKWYEEWPEYANANNSVVVNPGSVSRTFINSIIDLCKEWGEPGFFFTTSTSYGINPCGEALLVPQYHYPDGKKTGWGFCNLCEINMATVKDENDYYERAKAAAIIGTLQAGYNNLGYLGKVAEDVLIRDSLLGVGMTGMMESPDISLNAEFQVHAAKIIRQTNKDLVDIMVAHGEKINYAVRATVVKPSGTSSLELGIGASGIHPEHARYYIRRVTANPTEPVFQHFMKVNPNMVVKKPNGDYVIEFPMQAGPNTVVKSDLTATEFLNNVLLTQLNWIEAGTSEQSAQQNAYHGVSNTVFVKPDEWEKVKEFIWNNRMKLHGTSLLSYFGDKDFDFAPMMAVATIEDELRWNSLVQNYKPVDYTKMVEYDDYTNLTGEAACSGGSCELV